MGGDPFPVRVAAGEASQFPLSGSWSQNRALARNHVNTNGLSYFQPKKEREKGPPFLSPCPAAINQGPEIWLVDI
jgi:hypothetical protein